MRQTISFLLICCVGSFIISHVSAQSVNRQFHNETSEEIAHAQHQKGSDLYGKIAEELLDKVFTTGWRNGHFVYKPGVQATDYQLPVRVFFDPKEFSDKRVLELASETQFRPMGKPKKSEHKMEGTVPAAKLLSFNNVPGILAVVPPHITTVHQDVSPAPYAVKHSNPIPLQKAGVQKAWEKWGKGKGIKIGIIDGGFITLPMLFDANILPKDQVHLRTVLPEKLQKQHPYGTGVHGAAVAEVIHEIAPEAEIYLYPTMVIPSMWEKAVQMAVEDGVHVINSSLNSTLGVLDGVGTPNKYLDPAIEAGIIYVNSAGNYGAATYVSPFEDSDDDMWHNFSTTDEGNTIYFNKGDQLSLTLIWDDFGSNQMLPNSDQDLDLYLFYVDPHTHKMVQVAESLGEQRGETSQLSMPAERLMLQHGAPKTGNYSVMIRAHRIDKNRVINMRLIAESYDLNAEPPNIYKRLQYSSRQMTMTKPADHPDVITVAACGVDGNVHPYSGTGPTEEGKLKPDITSYTGLMTSSMQDPFLGTSCASPFVAGCAALLRQKYDTAEKVKAEIKKRALNPPNTGIKGHDPSSGWGIICLDEPDPENPSANLVSISRYNDLKVSGVAGFNFVTVFTCEKAKGDQLYNSMYFLKSDGSTIKANEDMEIYSNSKHDLRISAYVTPSHSNLVAFESWLLVPSEVLEFAGEDAQVEIRLEDEDGDILDKAKIGSVKDLNPPAQPKQDTQPAE